MKYTTEIIEIITKYKKINLELSELEQNVNILELRKNELIKNLSENKQREDSLIDKIVKETGKPPDYYKIMLELNEY